MNLIAHLPRDLILDLVTFVGNGDAPRLLLLSKSMNRLFSWALTFLVPQNFFGCCRVVCEGNRPRCAAVDWFNMMPSARAAMEAEMDRQVATFETKYQRHTRPAKRARLTGIGEALVTLCNGPTNTVDIWCSTLQCVTLKIICRAPGMGC